MKNFEISHSFLFPYINIWTPFWKSFVCWIFDPIERLLIQEFHGYLYPKAWFTCWQPMCRWYRDRKVARRFSALPLLPLRKFRLYSYIILNQRQGFGTFLKLVPKGSSKSKSKWNLCYDWRSVGHLGPWPDVWCRAPCLTTERVRSLHLLLSLASAVVLGFESFRIDDSWPHFTVSSSCTWRGKSPYLYPPGGRWPSCNHRHWVCTHSTHSLQIPPLTLSLSSSFSSSVWGLLFVDSERTKQRTPFNPALLLLRAYIKVKVTLRPIISRPPSWCQTPIWDPRPIFLSPWNFRQLRVCYFVAPSLTRGWVCNLLLLLVLASTVPLGSALSEERSGLSFVSISL
jgi:hypothetical protein